MMIAFGLEGNRCWGCMNQEKAALLHLKAVFKVAQHDSLSSWTDDEKSDCCDGWEGVTCGPNGRVFSLSLPKGYDDAWDDYDTSFKLHFNASVLLPFRDIRQLNLSRNGILTWTEAKGSIKLSASLTKLQALDLSNNYLSSSIVQQLSGFDSLRSLSLSKNQIEGHVQPNEVDAISRSLTELDLSYNGIYGFAGEYTEALKSSTTYLTKLELLDLSRNDELGNKIIPNVSWLPALKHLKLGDTGLTGRIVIHDIEAIENLVELDLSKNRITGFVNNKGTTRLSTRLPKLEQLNLGSNPLDNSILSALSGLSSLKHLNLAKCGLTFTGQIELHGTMNLSTSLAQLELLDLSWNGLTNRSLSTLSRLPSLRHLILQENSLGQVQLHDIEAMKNLEELDLSFCAITGFVSYTGTSLSCY